MTSPVLASSIAACALLATALQPLRAASPAAPDPAALETVTVTATLSEHDLRLAPASTTVIDRAELESGNPQNVLEAVRQAPGITLSPRQVGGRKTLSLRGMEGRHVLTMVDGRRIVATDDVVGHSDYQYGWVPMAAVERIEVIRGPMSTLYGSEALGGVINLITRQPRDAWEGDLGARGAFTDDNGDHRAGAASLYAGGPLGERMHVRVSGVAAYTPSVRDPEDARYSALEGSRVRSGTLGARFDLGHDQHLELNHFQGLEKRFYDDVSYGGVAYDNEYDIRRRQTDLAWRREGGNGHGQLRAYQGRTEITNERSHGVTPTRPQALEDTVIDGHWVFPVAAHTLTVGGEGRRETLENAGLTGGSDRARHEAAFVQGEARLGRSLTLTTGLRYDHHELFGHELSPRAYLVWEAAPRLVVKGGYGHAFKAPTLKQISPNYVGAEGPHTFLGNAGIRPETLDAFELSASWQRGGLSLQGTVFHSKVDDLITYRLLRVMGPRHVYQYDNVDKARIRGLEAAFGWQISPALSWQTSLTLLDTEDRTRHEELQYRPDSSVSSRIDWQGGHGWSARLGVQRIGAQFTTEGELPAYAVWNAGLGKDLGRNTSLRLAVENLGNLRLAEKSPLFGYTERGRTLSLDLRVRF